MVVFNLPYWSALEIMLLDKKKIKNLKKIIPSKLVKVLKNIWQKCQEYMVNDSLLYGKRYRNIWEMCQKIYGKCVTGK